MKRFCLFFYFSLVIGTGYSQTLNGEACSISKKKSLENRNKQARLFYPGDQNLDIVFHRIKLNINPETRFLEGSVFTNFKVILPTSIVSFDLQSNMKVDSITVNQKKITFTQANNRININFTQTIKANETQGIEIFYRGTPRTSAFGSFSVGTHGATKAPVVWTLSEPYGAPDWWPCKDDPSDKIDSTEVWITLPSNFVSVSNGLQKNVVTNTNGTKTYQWKNSHPISHYLISIACSNYQLYQNTFNYRGKTMPVDHYIYPEALTTSVKKLLDQTTDMLTFFSDIFGEYPFIDEKYGHAMCNFGGGMEHQTISSMGSFSEDLISHELAHQWFGDKITCKTWSDIFVSEAFASYSEALYQEHKYGKEAYLAVINDHIGRAKKTTEPIFISNPANENLVFDYALTYGKGAVVLHMLRGVLGDSIFFKTLKDYQSSEFAHKSASIDDFRKVAERTSQKDLKYFFDEWIYGISYPKFTFSYKELQPGLIKIDLNQEKLNSNPSFFILPFQIKIVLNSGKEIYQTLFQNEINQSFEIKDLPEPVKTIIFDPNLLIMKELTSLGSITGNSLETEYFNIFPNPSGEYIEINHPVADLQNMEIWNLQGQKIMQVEPSILKINIQNLTSGAYLLKLNGSKQTQTATFIKN